MIKILKPYIKKDNDKTKVYCDIYISNEKKIIWFEVENKYSNYLVDDRIDAYVIGLLNYAMRNNEDIVSDVPITEDLLYNIETTLIPSLAKYGKSLYNIKITAPVIEPIKQGNAVGTGCSCGIDSFDAIKNHLDSKYKSMNITHLCLNNVGAYNECYKEYGIDKVKNERYEVTKKVAKELNVELIETDSNFASEIPQNHYLTNTYSCCFAIYMLQKLWKKYYLASAGLDYSKFTIVDNDIEDSAHYDLLTLQCFSHEGIRIFSESGEKNRLEKTINISNFKPAQKYLHVCINKPFNCGICTKCRRTLVSLDAINKLEEFKEVFDIDYYKNHKIEYYDWLLNEHVNKNEMNEPSYQILSKRKDYRNSFKCKIKCFVKRTYIFKIYKKYKKCN